jgi:hypothetical protein
MFDFSSLVGNRFQTVIPQPPDARILSVEIFGAFWYEGAVWVIASVDGGQLTQFRLDDFPLKPCPETRVQPF